MNRSPMNHIPLWLYQGHPISRPEHLYDYVLAEQGLVKRVENAYASADCLLAPISQPLTGLRLRPYPLEPLRFKLPRIPGRLLQDVLADARGNLGLEFMYHFALNPGRGHWQVTRPEQEQSRTRVGYTYASSGKIALDLHSHHTMPAFFSPTDDHDERGGRFYGVMGHLDRARPELALRLGLYGTWLHNVPGRALFEELGPFVEVYLEAEEMAYVETENRPGGWFSNLF